MTGPSAIAAFAAGVFAIAALADLVAGVASSARAGLPRALRTGMAMADAVVAAGSEGRDPRARERRHLLLAGGIGTFALGLLLSGPPAALLLGAGGPWLVGRLLRSRRRRYRRAVDSEAAAIATALAGALGGGHSLRSSVAEAALAVTGPAGHELARVSAELAAGARTDHALEAMQARVHSSRIDALVAACLVQRRAGGDLALLLRECAEAFGDQSRLEDEVRSATAQARFTGLVVVLMPVGGALLAELAQPGFLIGLWSSFLTAWLVGLALVLQAVATVAIRRLGRVRW
ncbi:MAG: type II secretion system F family protein [Thermoleophilaceae bacterium]